jgi:carbonic anhydrase
MTHLPLPLSLPTLAPLALALAAALCTLPARSSTEHAPAKAEAKPAAKAPAKAADDAHGKPAAETARPTGKTAADPMEVLRERLAEKLGATKAPEAKNPNLVRVTARLDAPKAESHDGHGAPSAAPRKPSAAVQAAVDAHRADKAAASPGGAHAGADGHAAHWAYNGETGPAVWGGLKPEFQLCAVGKRQSPIDIRGGIAVELDPVQFDYRGTGFNVIDNGHTVQVNLGTGNSIQVGGRRFELVQFHFHRPAEERINGRQYDMSLHLVHKDPEGRLAVVGLLLERGAPQPVVQSVWNNLPLEKGEEQPASRRDRPEPAAAARTRLLHLHGLADHAPVQRGRAVDGDAPAGGGVTRPDRHFLAPVPDERTPGAVGGGAADQAVAVAQGGGGAFRRVNTSSTGHSHRLASQRSTRATLTGRVSCCATRTNSTTAPTTT